MNWTLLTKKLVNQLSPIARSFSIVLIATLTFALAQNKTAHSEDIHETLEQMTVKSFEGQPIANAEIQIGIGDLAIHLITDEQGHFTAPVLWNTAETVTIRAIGFIQTSYLRQTPFTTSGFANKTYFIHNAPVPAPQTPITLKGQAKGFEIVNNDNLVDFSIQMQAFDKMSLLNFQMEQLISPENDVIDILGQPVSIPKNISIPTQKERYYFGVTFEKPIYTLNFNTDGMKKIWSLHGKFPFREVVKAMQNKIPTFELINYFSFQSGSLNDVLLHSPGSEYYPNISELQFNSSILFNSPYCQADEIVLVSTLQKEGDSFIPIDSKKFESNEKKKLTTFGNSPYILNIIKKREDMIANQNKDKFSAALIPLSNSTQVKLLPLVPPPKVNDISTLILEKPLTTNELIQNPSTFLSLYEIKDSKIVRPVWEVYSSEWVDAVQLPLFQSSEFPPVENLQGTPSAGEAPQTPKWRWTVRYLSSSFSDPSYNFDPFVESDALNVDLLPHSLDSVTHVTQSSQDF